MITVPTVSYTILILIIPNDNVPIETQDVSLKIMERQHVANIRRFAIIVHMMNYVLEMQIGWMNYAQVHSSVLSVNDCPTT